jgi:hypothetical protein
MLKTSRSIAAAIAAGSQPLFTRAATHPLTKIKTLRRRRFDP